MNKTDKSITVSQADALIKAVFLSIIAFGISLAVNVSQYRSKQEIEDQLRVSNANVEVASQEAFRDCQRIMVMQTAMSRITTCYNIVETMCSGKKECTDNYYRLCQNEYE